MATNHQSNPLKVVGSWGTGVADIGSIDILNGRIDGSYATVSRDNPNWTREFDAHGNSTRVRNNNTGGNISVTLSASSDTHRLLANAALADELSENVVGTLTLRDLSGSTEMVFNGAYLEGPPATIAFGTTRGEHTWIFQFGSSVIRLAGHDTVG